MSDTVEMTDEEETEFEAAIADPASIRTEAHAIEVMECLDADIAEIRIQLDGAKIEAEVCGSLSVERRDWVRRASTAMTWKIRQRSSVNARLGELRPQDAVISGIVAQVSDKVRIAEFHAQAAESLRLRQAEKQAAKERNIVLANRKTTTQAEMFVRASVDVLPGSTRQAIWDRAREMFPDDPNWT